MTHDQKKTSDKSFAEPDSWFQAREIVIAGLVLVLGLASWIMPERTWLDVAGRLAARRLRRSPRFDREELATIRVIVGDQPPDRIEATFRPAWLAHKYHSWMQILACHRPGHRRPRSHLIGREHLDAALRNGSGVMLLTANFAYQDLMAKAALAGAGYEISYLARDTHGFADSRLGRRLLNPLYTSIERRFLKEHLFFSGDRTRKVNGQLKARLRDNRPVMVLVTPLGRQVATLPFLNGQIRIATGALNFACATGAPVLPVFTVRREDGRIETIVGQALKRPRYRSRRETILAMLEDYVPKLQPYVEKYPDQFAFPTSSRHGEALIEPRPASVESPEEPRTAAPRPEVAQLA
jgi:lauroyl/myristoyl acyltransferase